VDSEFLNSLVALNVGQGADTSGNFVSLGGNLIGVTNGGTGFTAPGDLTGSSSAPIDPQIGPLADNGGPTLTMALMPGSPAINAGRASGGSSTDQRGTPRPQGTGPDIGAFEYQFAVPVITSARFQSASRFWLQSCGLPEHGYILQVSTNLATWRDVTNLTANVYGVCEAVDTNVVNAEMRFYRLNTPGP
jgi:hypothetical protein